MRSGKKKILGNIELETGTTVRELSTDGTLSDNSDDALVTEKAIKTYVDENAVPTAVQKNEDNIMINAFRIAVNGSLSQFNMIDGIVDEYEDESGIDTVNSTNERYNSTDDYYDPSRTLAEVDEDTKLMLHFNGVDGSFEILDDGNTGHIITQNATAQLKTDQKKWGSSSVWFDGNSDYLSIPDSADWDVVASDSDNWTIECWVRWNSHPGGGQIMTLIDQFANASNYWQLKYKDNTLRWEVQVGGTGIIDTGYVGSITDSDWHHVAMCKVADEYGLYVDGTQIGYTQDSSTNNFSGSLYIGQRGDGGNWFDGYMDEIRIIHSNIFSASPNSGKTDTISVPTGAHTSDADTKLLLHCNTQDVSDSHHIPDFIGTAQLDTAQKKWGTGSLLLDGNSDYILFSDSSDWDFYASNSDNKTIDCWVKIDNLSASHTVCQQYQDSNNRWVFHYVTGNGFKAYFTAVGDYCNTGYTGVLSDTNWHHLALIKVANEYGVYIDGVQKAYCQANDITNISGNFYIGVASAVADFFDGHIDEFKFQHSNSFSAAPNVGLTDTITVPTAEYSDVLAINDMTLISDTFTAEAAPDNGRIIVLEEDVDAITLNTDLKAYMSIDGGSNWHQGTLSDEGDYDANKRILVADFDVSAESDTSVEYKITTHNSKDLKLHATGLSWD
jgi:hypothetical protein